MCVVYVCVYIFARVYFGMGTCGGQKNWNPELELQEVVSHLMKALGLELWSSERAEGVRKCWAVSPAPLPGLRSFLWLFHVKSSVNLPQACFARQAFIRAQHNHVISMQITNGVLTSSSQWFPSCFLPSSLNTKGALGRNRCFQTWTDNVEEVWS